MITTTEPRVPSYQYSTKTIGISLKAICASSAGFRCLASLWRVFQEAFIWSEAPTHAVIRQWLLKLGLFKLQQTHVNGKWMLIVDSTIQMGSQKVLLVLGIRLDKLQNSYNPSFEEAEPLVMKVIENCPGEVIQEVILEAIERVGDVAGIISDAGAEMKKGMKLLAASGRNTPHVFDIVHLISNLLKAELGTDDDWLQYKQECADMTQIVKLSDFAHLSPPRQRSKARLMASSTIIEWGQKLLAYVDSLDTQIDKVNAKLAWILKYRNQLDVWIKLLCLSKLALELVHEQGYHRKISLEWDRILSTTVSTHSRIDAFAASIRTTLKREGDKLAEGEHCLGSSVIIESAFGKFKQLEGHHASSGITSLVLALPAIFGETDENELAKALNNISVNDLSDWQNENIGQTYLSKRKAALKTPYKDLELCEYFTYKTA